MQPAQAGFAFQNGVSTPCHRSFPFDAPFRLPPVSGSCYNASGMKTQSSQPLCRPPLAPGFRLLLVALALFGASRSALSQDAPIVTPAPPVNVAPDPIDQPASVPNPASQNVTPDSAPQNPVSPVPPRVSGGIPTPRSQGRTPETPSQPIGEFSADIGSVNQFTGAVEGQGNVIVTYAGTTLTADRVTGDFNRELIFSGHAHVRTAGANADADAIHFFPRRRAYRLENPRGILEPSFLQYRVYDPVFVRGGAFSGTTGGYSVADHFHATTCIETHPHYELRVASAELIPDQRLILRRVGVFLFGQKLIVLPTLIVPLDRRIRRARTDYLPEFGQNTNEGYYARFPYEFAIGAAAATFLRLDLTQKRGAGYRVEQEYLAGKQGSAFDTSGIGAGGGFSGLGNAFGGGGSYTSAYGYGALGPRLPRLGTGLGPQSGGLFAAQGYVRDGFDRNFNASLRHQQSIGGSNRIGFVTELQRNSFFVTTDKQSAQTTRFTFDHADNAHGVVGDAALNYTTNDSRLSSTSQLTGNYRQTFAFADVGANRNNLTFNFDLSRYLSSSTAFDGSSETSTRSARLDSLVQFQHAARDYTYQIQANRSVPIGTQTQGSNFGTLERLPELLVSTDTYNFKGGWLRKFPAHFDIGVGRYSEPVNGFSTQTERALFNLNVPDVSLVRGRTEVLTTGGFEQRYYGDGAAQYQVRNQTRLRQHLGGRSGIDLNYQYEQPEGGTPFQFDTYGRTHFVTAEGGYLDDRRFQITARVGYDLLGASQQAPWQSLATRLLWRPTPSVRFDSLNSFDPNTGRFISASASARFRGPADFALDLLTRYDPQRGRFSQVNGQFDIPLGRTWRLLSLLRYSGLSGRFESENVQLVHEWDCLEASLTYTETPFGFHPDRQIFFTLRLKAFPFARSFARGPAGESLGGGLGDLY